MKKLLLLFLLLPFVSVVNAKEKFIDTLHSTFECSDKMPEKNIPGSNIYLDGHSGATKTNSYKYYLFTVFKDGRRIVENDGKQFTTYREIKVEQSYNTNGATVSLKHRNENNVDIYTLTSIFEDSFTPVKKRVKTMMIDLNSLTYTMRTNNDGELFPPSMGVCYSYTKY